LFQNFAAWQTHSKKGSSLKFKLRVKEYTFPVRATYNIEHEREAGQEEIEFQIKWSNE
jgi:hypothetical protein